MKKNRELSYLWEATCKNRIALASLVFFEAVISLVSIGFVMAMRQALDSAVAKDMTALQKGIFWMSALVAFRIILRALLRHLEEKVRASVENHLKQRLLTHLLYGDYAHFQDIHTGEWMNRLTSDTTVVSNGIAEILPRFVGMSVKLAGALTMIIVMIPEVSYFLLPAGALAIGITWVLRKYIKLHHKKVQQRDGEVRSYLQERLGSMMVVRAFRAEEAIKRESSLLMQEHMNARMSKNRISNICNIGFAGLMNALYIIGFAVCGFGIAADTVTYGTLLAVIQLIGQIQSPFAGLSGIVPRFYSMTASAERLLEAESFRQETAITFPDADFRAIEVDKVSFTYPDANALTVFSDVSMRIERGDYIALTGYSGCGKSTLFKLLLCLYSAGDGRINVELSDGTMRNLDASMRGLFSYVPQGNHLMSGTVREVVAFTDADNADTDRIRRALYIACADSFVDELEDGLETMLGEHGAGISEGQMQRLAIARALYADTPVLLLDEVTSSLDEETERMILQRLRDMTDKTVLIVTHRPAALKICNRIFEVTEGKIVELDTE